ncbi:MAG: ABC transporter permease [bacterium]
MTPSTRRLFRKPSMIFGLTVLLLVTMAGVFPQLLSPRDPYAQDLGGRLRPPGWVDEEGVRHLLGTDQLGRDLLSRLTYASRVSLLVVVGVLPISGLVGVSMGLVSGYFRGWVDDLIMRVVDVRLAIPLILVLLAVMAIVGPSLRNTILLLGMMQWVDYAKLCRAQILSVRERDFVVAARAVGGGHGWIIVRHILPNIASTIIVVSTIQAPAVILTEAALSFLGLGVQPPTASWGQMLSESREYLWLSPWLGAFPGLAITATVLAANLVGDSLRDHLDPFTRTR